MRLRVFLSLLAGLFAMTLMAPAGVAGTGAGDLAQGPATSAPPTPPPATPRPVVTNDFLPEDRGLGECISAVPKPGCGSEARGGWRQTLVLVTILAGLALIVWRIVVGARKARPGAEVVGVQAEVRPARRRFVGRLRRIDARRTSDGLVIEPADRRLRDRWWFWLAVSLLPFVALVGAVWWSGRPPGYVDGVRRLDEAPCDDGGACDGQGLRIGGEYWPTECRSPDPALITDELVAQGPGGSGYRIDGVDDNVAFAVVGSRVCRSGGVLRSDDPVVVAICLDAARDPFVDC